MNKYQAWHEEAKMIIEDEQYVGEVYTWLHQGQPLKIRKPIGLKDEDEQFMYEGDIIRITNEDGDSENYAIVYQAYYDYPAFDTSPSIECDSNGISHAMAVCKVKVIGNIYQNPELLKEVTT